MQITTPGSWGNPKDDADYRPTTEADIFRAITRYKMYTKSRAEINALWNQNQGDSWEQRTVRQAAEFRLKVDD